MRLQSGLLLITFYFLVCLTLDNFDPADGVKLHRSPEMGTGKESGSEPGSGGNPSEELSKEDADSMGNSENSTRPKEETAENISETKEETSSEESGSKEESDTKEESSSKEEGNSKEENGNREDGNKEGGLVEGSETTEVPEVTVKDLKEEDERNELKKLEEFKKSEILEKSSEIVPEETPKQSEGEKYQVESEVIQTSDATSDVKMTGENEFSVAAPKVNQVVNKIILPTTEERQLQIEMKNDFEPESGIEESKQTKSVLLTFDLSTEDLFNKISLISDSRLILTRYTGVNPQKLKVTIVDPTLQLGSSETRLSELSKFDSMEYSLDKKLPGKADSISLSEISGQIPVILQQYNTTNLRLLLEAADLQTQFGILANMEGVGPKIVLELKPTVESNSTWMYTITGVAIIFVIIGVSIALYFQNKGKDSQKPESAPLLNKV
ncbi:hypothetical protein HWI79_2515 [Cryptosporidium felis]|nr:hypothetical protein HWI79_2515 [Cryptosporidium felis]